MKRLLLVTAVTIISFNTHAMDKNQAIVPITFSSIDFRPRTAPVSTRRAPTLTMADADNIVLQQQQNSMKKPTQVVFTQKSGTFYPFSTKKLFNIKNTIRPGKFIPIIRQNFAAISIETNGKLTIEECTPKAKHTEIELSCASTLTNMFELTARTSTKKRKIQAPNHVQAQSTPKRFKSTKIA